MLQDSGNRFQEFSPGIQTRTESNATIDPEVNSQLSSNSELYSQTSSEKIGERIDRDDAHGTAYGVNPDREREWLKREVEVHLMCNLYKTFV